MSIEKLINCGCNNSVKDPFDENEYILVVCDALNVPSMTTNLIFLFIMSEHKIQVKDIPKTQIKDPDVDDHCLVFDDQLKTHLQLYCIVSYFNSRKPTLGHLKTSENIYL